MKATDNKTDTKSSPDSNISNTFDLYKHIKYNIKDIDSLCKDPIRPDSLYCFDCKHSSCPRCKDFNTHKNHSTIVKFPYYQNNKEFIPEHFQDLDNLFALNLDYLNVDKIRGELKILVDTEFKALEQQLNKAKKAKMDEIDSLFKNKETCVDDLKKNIDNLKNALNNFINSQKEFYNLNLQENIPTNEDYKDNEPLKTEEKKLVDNLSPEIGNNDYANIIFLTNYDLLRVINNKNKDIKNIFINIKDSIAKYKTEFSENVTNVKTVLNQLNESFKDKMRYSDLTDNHYKEVEDKMIKYNENIKNLKQTVFDSVLKHGNFEELEKLNTFHESKQKQNIENILNSQENRDIETMSCGTGAKKRIKQYNPSKPRGEKSVTAITGKPAPPQETKRYENTNEINLNSVLLQKFFTYLTLDVVSRNFRQKKASAIAATDSQFTYIEDFDEDNEIAKPIPETNEIHLYDRKTRTITKRKVPLDKTKHKYSYFLNGCRSVVIKDRLYITGGVDKENNETNVCFVYYLKTNEIKSMPDMINKRAYHSIEFLESYKSILVVGGENNPTCELYDMYSSKWRNLPELNYARANCCIYLDRMTNMIYTCFGIIGNMSNIKMYSDVMECIELKRTNLGWMKVNYNNKAEMDFRNGYCRIFPLDNEKILIYGASGIRESKKKGAIYIINKQEIVKIDNKLFNEIKIQAKKSLKLNKIISSIGS